jgi:anti-anti-sigma factor
MERHGDTRVLMLEGELDLANAGLLETELGEALGDGACRIVVDMRRLEFIDSTGIALLVAALGQDGDAGRLRFVPSQTDAVTRVLQLTGVEERLPLADGVSTNGRVAASGAD